MSPWLRLARLPAAREDETLGGNGDSVDELVDFPRLCLFVFSVLKIQS